MLRRTNSPVPKQDPSELQGNGSQSSLSALLTVMGGDARLEGKFDITDSIEIECKVGGELKVGGKLVIGERGSVHADVRTVDAIIETNSLVISKGGFFNGNVVKLKETEEGKPAVHLVKEKPLAQAK